LIGVVVAREDMAVGCGPAERDGCAGGGCLDVVGDQVEGGTEPRRRLTPMALMTLRFRDCVDG
jgi:hypothetical protein